MGPYPREISVASNLFYKFNPPKRACFLALSYLIHIEMERTSHLVPFIIRLCSCKWWTGRCWMPPAIHSSGESVHWLLRGGFPWQKRLPFCQMMRTLPLTRSSWDFQQKVFFQINFSMAFHLRTFSIEALFLIFFLNILANFEVALSGLSRWCLPVPGGAHLLRTQRLGLRVAGASECLDCCYFVIHWRLFILLFWDFVRLWLRGFDSLILLLLFFSLPHCWLETSVKKKLWGEKAIFCQQDRGLGNSAISVEHFHCEAPPSTHQVVSDVLAGGHPLGAGTDRQCAELWSSNPDFLWQVRYGGGGIPWCDSWQRHHFR